MVQKKTCYKCGKTKIAILSPGDEGYLATPSKIKMTVMSYGKHKDEFCCKNCKED